MEHLERRLENLTHRPQPITSPWAPEREQAAARNADIDPKDLGRARSSAASLVSASSVSASSDGARLGMAGFDVAGFDVAGFDVAGFEEVDEQTMRRSIHKPTEVSSVDLPSFDAAVLEEPIDSARVTATQRRVSEAYSALHGHPLEHDGRIASAQTATRWQLSVRSGAAMLFFLLLCCALAFVVYQWQSERTPKALPDFELDLQSESKAQADPDYQSELGMDELMLPTKQEQLDSIGQNEDEPNLSEVSQQADKGEPTAQLRGNGGELVVHVAGAVKKPGVYSLAQRSRINDAINAAGGSAKKADLNRLNLARVLVDGEQIYVPQEGEEVTPVPVQVQIEGGQAAEDVSGLINVNTASSETLQNLPGIGPAIAARIIDFREAHGGFASVKDLQSVSGIGPAMMAKIQDKVSVN